MAQSTFLLVDGTAVAYRAFYAIADLATDSGQPTNAVYGFIRMLRQLEKVWSPTHLVVVFDGGSPAVRLQLCPEYKAQRKPMPDELRSQFAVIEEFLDRAGIVHIRHEAQEADDVMASLAESARRGGMKTVMATSDKDMFQLVDQQVVIVSPSKASETMGPAEVRNKTGVSPEQMVDWQALTGDTVDNIAGVPGVGPKTAAQLLEKFGTVESLLERLEEVESERIRRLLEEHREVILRNLKMMRLRRDLPGLPAWERLEARPEDSAAVLEFYEKYQLRSLTAEEQKRMARSPQVQASVPEPPRQQEMFLF